MVAKHEGADTLTPLGYMRKRIRLVEILAENRLTYAVQHKDISALIRFAQSLLEISEETFTRLKELAPDPELACHKGCGLCCHSHIELNPIFAFYVYDYLQKTRTQAQWAQIKGNMASEERCCPLLEKDICSIYPARPPVCRAWYSLDLALCKKRDFCAPQKDYNVEDAFASQHYMVFLYVLEKRLQTIEMSLGLDPQDVHLKDMLIKIEQMPEMGTQWLNKQSLSLHSVA